jgi:hypothetical protein
MGIGIVVVQRYMPQRIVRRLGFAHGAVMAWSVLYAMHAREALRCAVWYILGRTWRITVLTPFGGSGSGSRMVGESGILRV